MSLPWDDDDPRARPDFYRVDEQSAEALRVLRNDEDCRFIARVNGVRITEDQPVTLPSGASVELVWPVWPDLSRPFLIYHTGAAFEALLSGTAATDRFTYSAQSQFLKTDLSHVSVTITGASDTSGWVHEPMFRALDYTASYGDLSDAFSLDRKAATRHFETMGYREGREISFDALEYIASYRDLAEAFGPEQDAGSSHFIATGRHEGRGITFDGLQYIASYDDLIAAFGVDQDAGARHFIANGRHEGRQPDSFDAARYLANYPDLQAAFGADQELATAHFIAVGHAEGRSDAAPASAADFMW